MTTRKPYSTDISDSQWSILKPLIPPSKPGGRPRTVDMREIINAIFYLRQLLVLANLLRCLGLVVFFVVQSSSIPGHPVRKISTIKLAPKLSDCFFFKNSNILLAHY
jgi:hypothetical protein